jgi:hypothetical protein
MKPRDRSVNTETNPRKKHKTFTWGDLKKAINEMPEKELRKAIENEKNTIKNTTNNIRLHAIALMDR